MLMALLLTLSSLLMEFLSAVISFVIGYYALKGYRVSSERGLLLLHFGFVTLGVSMTLRVITTFYVIALIRELASPKPAVMAVLTFASIIYSVVQLIAYWLFAANYTRQAKMLAQVTVLRPLFMLRYEPFLELIAIVLLGYVAVQSLINLAMKRNTDAFLVTLGFSFMFVSHLFFLFTIVEAALYTIGQIAQLIGFLCLLVMLTRVSRLR
jgi:hypothetical protein